MIDFRTGNVLDSEMQTLVNTVNTVGVMGKGIALQFKKRYPKMFKDYRARYERGELQTGEPYLHKAHDRWILNFPTKQHYRNPSRLEYIEEGLKHLRQHYAEWGIQSLALPALGCGHGGLDWQEVKALIERYLGDLPIPIEVYEPDPEGLAAAPDPGPTQLSLFAAATEEE